MLCASAQNHQTVIEVNKEVHEQEIKFRITRKDRGTWCLQTCPLKMMSISWNEIPPLHRFKDSSAKGCVSCMSEAPRLFPDTSLHARAFSLKFMLSYQCHNQLFAPAHHTQSLHNHCVSSVGALQPSGEQCDQSGHEQHSSVYHKSKNKGSGGGHDWN